MTREEKIQKAINGQQLLTFEEWYKINKSTFELLLNSHTPESVYEEYVEEMLGE